MHSYSTLRVVIGYKLIPLALIGYYLEAASARVVLCGPGQFAIRARGEIETEREERWLSPLHSARCRLADLTTLNCLGRRFVKCCFVRQQVT